jgi:hypothetical protein
VPTPNAVAVDAAIPDTGRPVRFVAVPLEGVPNAPPLRRTLTPSTANTPADTLERVVSVACPNSTVPTPTAVEVELASPAIGRPVHDVNVPDEGVPNAGVTSVGLVARTGEPEPVAAVHAGSAAAPPPTRMSVVAPAANV